MAEDIFLNFFQGLGTGMEAGRERRTLMQRARRGEISPQDVPGRFETMLTAMARASTPDSTRLAQDQLKLQTAKFALEKSLDERKQAALELKTLADLELANKEAEDEKNDTFLFTVKQNEARKAFLTGGMSEVYKLDIPQFASAEFNNNYTDFLKQLEATDLSNRIDEMEGTQALLLRLKVPEDQIPTNLAEAKDMLEQKLGIREAEQKREVMKESLALAKAEGADSVTVQLPEGGQMTIRTQPDEEVKAYTPNQLATAMQDINAQLARLETMEDLAPEQKARAKALHLDNFETLERIAKARGLDYLIPAATILDPAPKPTGPKDLSGQDMWDLYNQMD